MDAIDASVTYFLHKKQSCKVLAKELFMALAYILGPGIR